MASDTKAPCWICGDPADSGEHKAKRSDLRAAFGNVSPNSPLFFNDAANKNRRLLSVNSDLVKWPDMLCKKCNSTRSQPHDRAWEKMSRELRTLRSTISPGAAVQCNRIFPENTAREMLNVHLYFLKALGCLAVRAQDQFAKIDLAGFSNAILNGCAHPDVYLVLGPGPKYRAGAIVSTSDPLVVLDPRDGSCALAIWFYNVDGVCIGVAYAPGMHAWAQQQGLWHPRQGAKTLQVRDFADSEDHRQPVLAASPGVLITR